MTTEIRKACRENNNSLREMFRALLLEADSRTAVLYIVRGVEEDTSADLSFQAGIQLLFVMHTSKSKFPLNSPWPLPLGEC